MSLLDQSHWTYIIPRGGALVHVAPRNADELRLVRTELELLKAIYHYANHPSTDWDSSHESIRDFSKISLEERQDLRSILEDAAKGIVNDMIAVLDGEHAQVQEDMLKSAVNREAKLIAMDALTCEAFAATPIHPPIPTSSPPSPLFDTPISDVADLAAAEKRLAQSLKTQEAPLESLDTAIESLGYSISGTETTTPTDTSDTSIPDLPSTPELSSAPTDSPSIHPKSVSEPLVKKNLFLQALQPICDPEPDQEEGPSTHSTSAKDEGESASQAWSKLWLTPDPDPDPNFPADPESPTLDLPKEESVTPDDQHTQDSDIDAKAPKTELPWRPGESPQESFLQNSDDQEDATKDHDSIGKDVVADKRADELNHRNDLPEEPVNVAVREEPIATHSEDEDHLSQSEVTEPLNQNDPVTKVSQQENQPEDLSSESDPLSLFTKEEEPEPPWPSSPEPSIFAHLDEDNAVSTAVSEEPHCEIFTQELERDETGIEPDHSTALAVIPENNPFANLDAFKTLADEKVVHDQATNQQDHPGELDDLPTHPQHPVPEHSPDSMDHLDPQDHAVHVNDEDQADKADLVTSQHASKPFSLTDEIQTQPPMDDVLGESPSTEGNHSSNHQESSMDEEATLYSAEKKSAPQVEEPVDLMVEKPLDQDIESTPNSKEPTDMMISTTNPMTGDADSATPIGDHDHSTVNSDSIQAMSDHTSSVSSAHESSPNEHPDQTILDPIPENHSDELAKPQDDPYTAQRAHEAVLEMERGIRKIASLLKTDIKDQWHEAKSMFEDILRVGADLEKKSAQASERLSEINRLCQETQTIRDEAKKYQDEARSHCEAARRAKERADSSAMIAEINTTQSKIERAE